MKLLYSALFIALVHVASAQTLVKNINTEAGFSSVDYTFKMVEVNGKGFFNATDGIHGFEVWITDGTADGTQLLMDINPTPGIGSIIFDALGEEWKPVVLNNKVYFPAYNDEYITELWVSDGTPEGTELFMDINQNNDDPNPLVTGTSYPGGLNFNNFYVDENYIWFSALDGINGTGLWRTDGTVDGTELIKIVNTGLGGSSVTSITPFNNEIYFVANGTELWKSNGTESGTTLLQTFDVLTRGYEHELVEVNNALYFYAEDVQNGEEIWTCNSNDEISVLDITPGTNSTYPSQLTSMNGFLYFVGYDDVHGAELWKSNGSVAGTSMLTEINTSGNANINFPIDANTPLFQYQNKLYFSANNGIDGAELWTSDGTPEGTELVADNNTGSPNSEPNQFYVFNNKIYYASRIPFEGWQLIDYNPTTDVNTIHWEEGLNDNAFYRAKPAAVNGQLFLAAGYDYNDIIRDELYLLDDNTISVQSIDQSNIKMFPNPASDHITIQSADGSNIKSIRILDLTGKIYFLQTPNKTSVLIHVNDLPIGIYIIEITDNSETISHQKWVKE